jgi:hypothetical protein
MRKWGVHQAACCSGRRRAQKRQDLVSSKLKRFFASQKLVKCVVSADHLGYGVFPCHFRYYFEQAKDQFAQPWLSTISISPNAFSGAKTTRVGKFNREDPTGVATIVYTKT